MTTTHTPGPWKHRPRRNGKGSWYVTVANDGSDFIAECITKGDVVNANNARLIAAAPDLLKIAKQMLTEYTNLTDADDSYLRQDWVAVINKAEGQ